jgi:hypothetical protein
MKQHGRKSTASLAVGIIDGGFDSKVEPPEGTPERVAKIWRDTVRAEPAGFFKTTATQALLEDYCRQRAVTNEMADLINEFDPAWLAEAKGMRRYEWLCKMQRMASKAAMDLATKLRLTNQSRYEKDTAATAARVEVEEKDDDASPWMQAGKRSA